MNFELTNEATRANLQVNKRILKWRPFWSKVYSRFTKTFKLLSSDQGQAGFSKSKRSAKSSSFHSLKKKYSISIVWSLYCALVQKLKCRLLETVTSRISTMLELVTRASFPSSLFTIHAKTMETGPFSRRCFSTPSRCREDKCFPGHWNAYV